MKIVPTDGGRSSKRLASTAVYAAGPVAVLAVLWLRDLGLLAPTPMWIMAAVILGTGCCNLGMSILLARRPESTPLLHLRIAASVLCTGAVTYSAGWGSVLVISYALGSAELMRTIGARAARPNTLWNWAGIALGELAVATGIAPSMVDPALGHAVAITGGICLAIITDVLGRAARAAEEAEARTRDRGMYFESLIERATDIIGVISADGTVQQVSPSSMTMLGYSPEEAQGEPISKFLHPSLMPLLEPLLDQVIGARGESISIEVRLLHRDGSERVVIATLTSPSEEWEDRIVVNLHDMTTQRDLEEQLRHDARHDPLTGLLNRAAFAEASARVCARASRHGWTVGMLFIDLDGFKQVNDSFGHEIGDRVLIETADRLSACLRKDETLARLGGDEFAVLIGSVDAHSGAIEVAERILEVVSAPIPGLPSDVRVGASIGIALRSNEGIEMSTLMRQADEAMYSAKRNGRCRWELSPDLSGRPS